MTESWLRRVSEYQVEYELYPIQWVCCVLRYRVGANCHLPTKESSRMSHDETAQWLANGKFNSKFCGLSLRMPCSFIARPR